MSARIGVRKSLIEYENGDCVFFDNKTRKCNVYELRPRQCRTWPFWDSNIATPEAWKETCQVCPGSGQGKLYSVEEVLAQSSVDQDLAVTISSPVVDNGFSADSSVLVKFAGWEVDTGISRCVSC